jgi:RNA polymerase sigma-70 factor, ECF subfamily
MTTIAVSSEGFAKEDTLYTRDTRTETLARGVEVNDPNALEELHRRYNQGLRWLCLRLAGPDHFEDAMQQTLVAVIDFVQRGMLRDPSRLTGLVNSIAKNICAAVFKIEVMRPKTFDSVADNPHVGVRLLAPDNPERQLLDNERLAIARNVLKELSDRDREILKRFYVDEQSPEEICRAMNLTPRQFRNLKCRAKERFTSAGKKHASGNPSAGRGIAAASA